MHIEQIEVGEVVRTAGFRSGRNRTVHDFLPFVGRSNAVYSAHRSFSAAQSAMYSLRKRAKPLGYDELVFIAATLVDGRHVVIVNPDENIDEVA